MAHGVPGPIALLGAACAAGVAVDTARPLLEAAVRWLLRTGLEGPDGPPVVRSWWLPGAEPHPARTAWCYGAPGVAATLLMAACAAGEPAWEDAAVRLARGAATWRVDDSGVVDAGLCHGAAGLGLVFMRLHQATGEAELRDAARYWFEHALSLRRPGTGVAGFSTENLDGYVADPGLLTGTSGIALALHAAATDREPTWDRALLLSTSTVSATHEEA